MDKGKKGYTFKHFEKYTLMKNGLEVTSKPSLSGAISLVIYYLHC
jgi:hypothetical protein